MARIRSIKPEFWTDEKVVSLSPLARLLFIGMWNFVDDYGRAEFSPARIKMQILPGDNADIAELIGEIRRERLITVYAVDGKQYFCVNGFTKHQKVDKRQGSKLPAPPNSPEFPRISPPDQGGDQGKEEDQGSSEPNGSGAAAPAVVVPIDARTALFHEGLKTIHRMSGKPEPACRSLLGRWLKLTGDDAAALLATIRRAATVQVAEPIAWIERALKPANPDDAIYRAVDYAPPTPEERARFKAMGLS